MIKDATLWIIRVISLPIFFTSSFAQEPDTGKESIDNPEDRAALYAYGGIGPAMPLGKFGKERSTGFDLNTAIEYRFVSGLFLRGMFDFSSFSFERGTISQQSNGTTYDIAGSNNLVSLLASVGYAFRLKRFSPYLFTGMGASFLSIPAIEIDEAANYIDTALDVKSYLSLVAGSGIDIHLGRVKENPKDTRGLVLYLEAFYTYIPSTTVASVHAFSLLSANVGLKSKF